MSRKYDRVVNLKITSWMLIEIDAALEELAGVLKTRSDFLRAAVEYALYSMDCASQSAMKSDEAESAIRLKSGAERGAS